MPATYVNIGPPVIMPGDGLMSLPNGGKLAYVHSSGAAGLSEYPTAMGDITYTSVNAALAAMRASRGDRIICLPGHSESVTASTHLSALVAGVLIEGAAWGEDLPVFRWTNTAGAFTLSSAGVILRNLRLRLEGANGITKAINVTGAGVELIGCDVEVASGATAKAAIALEVGTGAHRFALRGCRFRGTATHNVTDGVKIVAAVVGFEIHDCQMLFSATAGNGLIHVTAAALNGLIARNILYNTHTASTACVALDDVATDGLAVDNRAGDLNDGTANAQGFVVAGSSVLWKFVENYSVDEKAKSGVITPAVVAT
jgi:hypothetical protein